MKAKVGNFAKVLSRLSSKSRNYIVALFLLFSVGLVGVICLMAVKSFRDSQTLIEQSVRARLMAIATAAEDYIDIDTFLSYTSAEQIAQDPAHAQKIEELRRYASRVGAIYVYALKIVDGKYYFVYDTDPEVTEFYEEYQPTPVHIAAADGWPSAVPYGAEDEFGSFATSAIPLYKDGVVVGVLSADIPDSAMKMNSEKQLFNTAMLVSIIAAVLLIMAVLLVLMMERVIAMQDKLFKMAHYDTLTNLPNRQYLFERIAELSEKKHAQYALFFVDLDNFKKVNDTAGHDAGDELLRDIAAYLSTAHVDTQAFRPSAGSLNVAARIGGDEFILVAPDLDADQAQDFAQELLDGLKTKVNNKSVEEFGIGFSVGIALYPTHSKNYHVILKYADIAMYHAKHAGKNTFMLYNEYMTPKDEK